MPISVIEEFKKVHIAHDQRQIIFRSLQARPLPLNGLVKTAAIGNSGKAINGRKTFQPIVCFLQRIFGIFPFCYILEARNHADDLSVKSAKGRCGKHKGYRHTILPRAFNIKFNVSLAS